MSKLILMGTNEFVVPVFDALSKTHQILSVFTRAPKPAGRKQILTKSPVHLWAEKSGIPVHTSIREFENGDADFVVVMSYGVILKDDVLASGNFINIHPSDLPKYRGPSPIRATLKNGDEKSAVCLIKIVHDLDAGDIYMRVPFDVDINDTNETVEAKTGKIAIKMLNEFLSDPEKYKPMAQVGTPIITHKFSSADTVIDWNKSPMEIHNLIRAYGAGRTKINGTDVKILKTTIENDNLKILEIQPAGKKPMDWKSFVNGLRGAEVKYGE